jgi:hypothetical protein
MFPLGFKAKIIPEKPVWLKAPQIVNIDFVNVCVNDNIAGCADCGNHIGSWYVDWPQATRLKSKRPKAAAAAPMGFHSLSYGILTLLSVENVNFLNTP